MNMQTLSKTTSTEKQLGFVLATLIALTLCSWLILNIPSISTQIQGLCIISLAFIKVRLVIRHFMEVKTANRWVQIAFDLWLLSAATGTILFYY